MAPGLPSSETRDLRHYLSVARRRYRLVLLLTVILPTLSVLFALGQEPRYSATSDVLIRRENLASNLTGAPVAFSDAQTAQRAIETQAQIARVPELAAEVAGAVGIEGIETAEDFLSASSAEAAENTDLLVLGAEASTPEAAVELARVYAERFSDYRLRLDAGELDTAARSVQDELARIDNPLGRNSPLWDDLQDRLRQIQTLQALQTPSAIVVKPADTADQTGPGALSMGLGGLVLGVVLGLGGAFLAEALDSRPNTSTELAERLGAKLLGRIPAPPKDLGDNRIVMMARPEDDAAEPFNFLRANLEFAMQGAPARSIMVTSAVEGEGKSTTVANLAVALAHMGRRVLAIDLDARRPTLHRLLGAPAEPGIGDVAAGGIVAGAALVEVDVPQPEGSAHRSASLSLLPAGAPGRARNVDPAALLAVIDDVKSGFDVVLVDSPPLLRVGDAVALAAGMEALVVVTRLGLATGPVLEELGRTLEAGPLRILGVVCTDTGLEAGYGAAYAPTGSRYRRAGDAELPGPAVQPAPPLRPEVQPEAAPPPTEPPRPLPEEAEPPGPASTVTDRAPVPEVDPASRAPIPSREEILTAVFERAGGTARQPREEAAEDSRG